MCVWQCIVVTLHSWPGCSATHKTCVCQCIVVTLHSWPGCSATHKTCVCQCIVVTLHRAAVPHTQDDHGDRWYRHIPKAAVTRHNPEQYSCQPLKPMAFLVLPSPIQGLPTNRWQLLGCLLYGSPAFPSDPPPPPPPPQDESSD